jgi:hypothetical protein
LRCRSAKAGAFSASGSIRSTVALEVFVVSGPRCGGKKPCFGGFYDFPQALKKKRNIPVFSV